MMPITLFDVDHSSPINSIFEISGGAWMARKTLGRSMDWTLYVNGIAITGGSLTSSDSFTSAKPFDFADGFGGTSVLTVPVAVGDVINLEIVKTSTFADFVGVDMTIAPLPDDLNGDVDRSGCVDTTDLDMVISCFGQTAPLFPPCDDADVAPPPEGDGVVNILDISFVAGNLGNGCP